MIKNKFLPLIIIVILIAAVLLFLYPSNQLTQTHQNNNQENMEEIGIEKEIEKEELKEGVKILSDGTKYIINPNEILSGGPQKDGIPSIDNPKFQTVKEADWLNDDDLILGLDYKGEQKAYPHKILNWHEIVNDFALDKPILVTYCPLCRTGIAFEPIIKGERVEFGTSGKLWKSNLVMYDRKTDTYWSQVSGQAIVGELSGDRLKQIPMDTVKWGDWKKKFPESKVLSRNTGQLRNYFIDPYSSFATSDSVGFGVEFEDTRLFSKAIVYGLNQESVSKAYSEEIIKEKRIINDEFADQKIVVLWDSELNVPKIFERTINGEELIFEISDDKLIDNKNRQWSLDGEFENLKLKRVDAFGVYWFSWAATYPQTELVYQ